VVPASFSAPSPEHFGTQAEALLLRDALLLSLRRGAGPFRSAEDVLDYCAEVTASRCGADAALSAREIAVIKCVMKMSADRIFSPSG
jgi:hypothetical protein